MQNKIIYDYYESVESPDVFNALNNIKDIDLDNFNEYIGFDAAIFQIKDSTILNYLAEKYIRAAYRAKRSYDMCDWMLADRVIDGDINLKDMSQDLLKQYLTFFEYFYPYDDMNIAFDSPDYDTPYNLVRHVLRQALDMPLVTQVKN